MGIARARTGERGAVLLAMVFVLVAGVFFALASYFDISLVRGRAVDAVHNKNRAFNLAEIALNEALHQANMNSDGIDNDGDDDVDEGDEGVPNVGTSAWDALVDDLGRDGLAGTNDAGEGDGYPTFGEPNVVPVVTDSGEYYAYVMDWETDGMDNNGDGLIDGDDPAEANHLEVNGFARQGGENSPITWVQYITGGEVFSVWDNAIFAGDQGAGGQLISGNAKVYGSIHILGDSLADDDPALDFSGTAGMRNDYADGDPAFYNAYLPPLVGDLDAKLRVKNGQVWLSGTGDVGTAAAPIDGAYVTDGYGGNQGESNVESENGTTNGYDLPEGSVTMPSLYDGPYTSPATQVSYPDYKTFYSTESIHINAATVPGWTGTINKTTDSFTVSNAHGSFIWDKATATITISGRVTVDGNLTLGGTTGPTKVDFTYTGSGALFSEASGGQPGTTTIEGNMLPGGGATFPTGAFMGFLAEGDIHCPSSAQKDLCGAFFAEGEITSAKQNRIGGAFVANSVDMGSQVPSIYYAQGLANAIPDWFPGAGGADVSGPEMYRVVQGE